MPMNQPASHTFISLKVLKCFFVAYFGLLFVCCFFYQQIGDALYYWAWGQHLALSYYDGPPFVGYILGLSHLILGTSVFAINIVGWICALLTSLCIYQIGKLWLDKEVGAIAALLWIINPYILSFLFLKMTYHVPACLFWMSTIYFVVRYFKFAKTRDIYLIGASIGLLLLSSYEGIVLVLALFIFSLFNRDFRQIYRNKNFYGALLLILLLVSPILIWNDQHNWISIVFQLHAHQPQGFSHTHLVLRFYLDILSYLNVLLIFSMMFYWQRQKTRIPTQVLPAEQLLFFIGGFFIVFWTIASFSNNYAVVYSVCISGVLTILAGVYLVRHRAKKTFFMIFAIYLGISLAIICGGIFSPFAPLFFKDFRALDYQNITKIAVQYPASSEVVLSCGYLLTSELAFILNNPNAHDAPFCDNRGYNFWDAAFIQQLMQKQVKQALYISTGQNASAVQAYFKHCRQLPFTNITQNFHSEFIQGSPNMMYVYQCTN